jgi:hypothetical protein
MALLLSAEAMAVSEQKNPHFALLRRAVPRSAEAASAGRALPWAMGGGVFVRRAGARVAAAKYVGLSLRSPRDRAFTDLVHRDYGVLPERLRVIPGSIDLPGFKSPRPASRRDSAWRGPAAAQEQFFHTLADSVKIGNSTSTGQCRDFISR